MVEPVLISATFRNVADHCAENSLAGLFPHCKRHFDCELPPISVLSDDFDDPAHHSWRATTCQALYAGVVCASHRLRNDQVQRSADSFFTGIPNIRAAALFQ
jgi:hypothetical protein